MNTEELLMPSRKPDHPSLRALESLAFDAEATHRGSELEAHVAGCPTCRASLEELRGGREAFLKARPAGVFLAKLEARSEAEAPEPLTARLTRWLRLPQLVMATAAAAALFVVAPKLLEGPEHPGVILKGELELGFAIHSSRRGEKAAALEPGQALREGDLLRFVVSLPKPGHVFVANLDDRGRYTRYYPARATESATQGAGADQVLPGSIELDDFVGTERIFLLDSAAPLEDREVEAALSRAFTRAQRRLEALGDLGLPARVESVLIHKEAS